MVLCVLFFAPYCKMCSFCKLKEIRATVWETKCRHFPGGPPIIIIKSLPDLRIHNTVSCQRKGIQCKRTHNKFSYCECLGAPVTHISPHPLNTGSAGSLITPLTFSHSCLGNLGLKISTGEG